MTVPREDYATTNILVFLQSFRLEKRRRKKKIFFFFLITYLQTKHKNRFHKYSARVVFRYVSTKLWFREKKKIYDNIFTD